MYLSIDLETTGLDPDFCQTLEIGAVLDYQDRPIMDCPHFRAVLKHDRITGDAYALAMNADLLRESIDHGSTPQRAVELFICWLEQHVGNARLHLLGKNVGSFDVQFLKKLPGFPLDRFSYRHLEVGSLMADRHGVDSLSDLYRLLETTCNFPGRAHTAVYDARMALAICRKKWEIAV